MSVALLTLLSLAVFVIAARPQSGEKVLLEEGWNLVHFYPNPVDSIAINSEIQIGDILAVYWYFNFEQKMYQAYPNSDDVNLEEKGYVIEDVIPYWFNSAYWIYSEKRGILEVNRDETKLSLDETKLSKGWNFVGITSEMFNGEYFSWDSIIGTCNIEKTHAGGGDRIYLWGYGGTQEWVEVDFDGRFFETDFEEILGQGMLVKVSEDCTLGSSSSGGTLPPPLP
tara:strand:+ start:929 stop:1603 length:675 start_codon:yes stop_codon:yes gene_type:complete